MTDLAAARQKAQELRELAEKATPGPWKDGPVKAKRRWPSESDGTAAYIAACDPSTISDLMQTLEKLCDVAEAAQQIKRRVVSYNSIQHEEASEFVDALAALSEEGTKEP